MPLSGPQIAAEIQAAGGSWSGLSFPSIAQAIGSAVQQWSMSPASLALSGTTSGSPGAGVVTGKLTLNSAPSRVYDGLLSAGVAGLIASDLAAFVSIGLAKTVTSAGYYTGSSVGVALGSDVSAVSISDPVTLTMLLNAYLKPGLTAPMLASGLGLGISSLFRTMTGSGGVAGTPLSGPPAVGSSPLSKVI